MPGGAVPWPACRSSFLDPPTRSFVIGRAVRSLAGDVPTPSWARFVAHRGGRVHALRCGPPFEGGRTDLAERRMAAPLVIEHLDVLEQLVLCVTVTLEVLAQFALDRREEALHHGVVVAVPASAHAARDAVGLEHVLIIFAGIRAPLVRMMEQPELRTASLQRHLERLDRQVPIVHRADRPADNEP